jgi:hypothetical protein
MLSRRINITKPQSKNFALKGGLNTEIAGIERPPGEMAICKNYVSAEGSYNGYQSLKGYERFDGNTAPSDVALETVGDEWESGSDYTIYQRVTYNGYVFYCQQALNSGTNAPDSTTPGDNTWWKYEAASGSEDEYNDFAREIARTAIKKVGETDSATGKVRGLHVHNSKLYAWRNTVGSANTGLWVSSASGWVQVAADSTAMTASGNIKSVTARFRYFPSGSANDEVMYWVDGVTEGFFYLDPVSGTYKNVTHANMPSGYAPKHIGVWEGRLFLCYEDGYTIFSNTGYPENFDSDTGTAGDIDFGEPVTGILTVAGKLVVFTRKFIKIVHQGSTTGQFVWNQDTFSETMGAFDSTIQNMFEQVFFSDDRGISGLFTAQETGGFSAKPISKKIDTEYQSRKLYIHSSVKDIAKRRYFLFYANSDGTATSEGLAMTFDDNNRLKGTGKVELKHKATTTASGINNTTGDSLMFFGDDLGYAYQMESGTSMDGETLDTYMVSGFYHYGSPGFWKHFERLQFEIQCAQNTDFTIGTIYEYGSPLLPNTNTQTEEVTGGAAVWGGGITWGTFTWGAGHLGRALVYIQGYSTNMAVTMETSSKYKTEHTIHNIMTNYTMGDVRQ